MPANAVFSAVLGMIFIALYISTIIGLVLIILLENRNPLKTIPWVIVLIFVPVIGLAFYYFFGRDSRRLRLITRRIYKRFYKNNEEESNNTDISDIPAGYIPLINLLNKSNYSVLSTGNNITCYTSGEDKFNDLIAEIKKAKHHIHLQYYIFKDDRTGNIIKELLIAKAKEGLIIRVIYDDVGCWNTKKKFFAEMKDGGIKIYSFLEVAFPNLTSKVNYRNHRKNVVIDGKVGFIGGMNIADRYVYGDKLGIWRDTHFKITGSGIHGLQSAFLLDWYSVSREYIEDKIYYPEVESFTGNKMQIVMTGPTDEWRILMQSFNFCITNAKKYIYIQTPYFLPTEELNQALEMAAMSGVDVRIMIPRKSDTRTAHLATFSYIEKMLLSGVKVYFYDNGFLHSKLLITDDQLTCFGSSNFDFRSFEHNFELNSFVYDNSFALEMKEVFMKDLQSCSPELSYSSWRKRTIPVRLAESFMRLFSPLL
jgi:cardiolipin synthase